jgi:hypothetical protein
LGIGKFIMPITDPHIAFAAGEREDWRHKNPGAVMVRNEV